MLQSFRSLLSTLCLSLFFLAPAATAHAAVAPLSASQCRLMQEKNTFHANNPVPCLRLARVSFRYRDFQGKLHDDGCVIVLDIVAPQVQKIFDELLMRRFPIHMAQPLELYQGDDEASMRDNNTSAFNGRPMTGGSAWSKHAYGVAIDINPLQNPYIGQDARRNAVVLPPEAASAPLNRRPLRPGMAEAVLDVFFRHGFLTWGGYWKQPVDYQHFEIGSRSFIAHLLALPPDVAQAEFQGYGAAYAACISEENSTVLPARRKACAIKIRR